MTDFDPFYKQSVIEASTSLLAILTLTASSIPDDQFEASLELIDSLLGETPTARGAVVMLMATQIIDSWALSGVTPEYGLAWMADQVHNPDSKLNRLINEDDENGV